MAKLKSKATAERLWRQYWLPAYPRVPGGYLGEGPVRAGFEVASRCLLAELEQYAQDLEADDRLIDARVIRRAIVALED